MREEIPFSSAYDRVEQNIDDENELEQDANAAIFKKICMDGD